MIYRMPDQDQQIRDQLDRIAQAIRERTERRMFAAVNELAAVFDLLEPYERQAWISWFQSKYGQ